MNLSFNFQHVNWLSVVVATLAAFAVGGLWYSPVLFSKAWQKEINMKMDENNKPNMLLVFGGTFVLQFISAIALDLFIGLEGTWLSGLHMGLLVSVAWIVTALGTNYLFARRSLKLFLIDAGYFVVYFLIMGAILGAW